MKVQEKMYISLAICDIKIRYDTPKNLHLCQRGLQNRKERLRKIRMFQPAVALATAVSSVSLRYHSPSPYTLAYKFLSRERAATLTDTTTGNVHYPTCPSETYSSRTVLVYLLVLLASVTGGSQPSLNAQRTFKNRWRQVGGVLYREI
jgi:hypothetical protein